MNSPVENNTSLHNPVGICILTYVDHPSNKSVRENV